jgi:hypothetical protein
MLIPTYLEPGLSLPLSQHPGTPTHFQEEAELSGAGSSFPTPSFQEKVIGTPHPQILSEAPTSGSCSGKDGSPGLCSPPGSVIVNQLQTCTGQLRFCPALLPRKSFPGVEVRQGLDAPCGVPREVVCEASHPQKTETQRGLKTQDSLAR